MHITPHMLRKFHATALKMIGVPEDVLQDRIGHTRGSRMTAGLYVNPQDEHRAAGVFELPVATAAR
jgi:integrase